MSEVTHKNKYIKLGIFLNQTTFVMFVQMIHVQSIFRRYRGLQNGMRNIPNWNVIGCNIHMKLFWYC